MHKQTVVVCPPLWYDDCRLLALRDWLTTHRAVHIALESTNVYWIEVYYVIETVTSLVS